MRALGKGSGSPCPALLLLILIDRFTCPRRMHILGRWCSTPCTEVNEILESVPIWLSLILLIRCCCPSSGGISYYPPPPHSSSRRLEPLLPPLTAHSCSPLPSPPLRLCLASRLLSTVIKSETSLAASLPTGSKQCLVGCP